MTQHVESQKLHRILVPTDFSAQSRAALDYAQFLANGSEAEIDVLYVRDLTMAEHGPPSERFFADSTQGHQMEELLFSTVNQPTQIRGLVEFGDPCDTIVRTAALEHADLIVMAKNERSSGLVDRSDGIAQRVMRLATCPVLLVGRQQHALGLLHSRGRITKTSGKSRVTARAFSAMREMLWGVRGALRWLPAFLLRRWS